MITLQWRKKNLILKDGFNRWVITKHISTIMSKIVMLMMIFLGNKINFKLRMSPNVKLVMKNKY